MVSSYQIKYGSWDQFRLQAAAIRTEVFIQEQQIAAADEWDSEDAGAVHFVLFDQDKAIATARLLPDRRVGRVAVLQTYRGQGLGKVLMQSIIDYAQQQHYGRLQLSAQVQATNFYQSLGFSAYGETYLDCGIPHIDMQLDLPH